MPQSFRFSQRSRRIALTLFTLCALGLLMLCSKQALGAAAGGLNICISVIVPSLLPFFVISSMLSALGFPAAFGRRLEKPFSALFRVSGTGAAAFFIGLTAGYPLGAATIADIYSGGGMDRREAESALAFCNNTGPAFILGTAGAGVFGSVGAGLTLYISHILAAVAVGILMAPKAFVKKQTTASSPPAPAPLPQIFVSAVKSSVVSVLNICGFIVFFSALLGALGNALDGIAGNLSLHSVLSLGESRALLTGIFELGGGITALRGSASGVMSLAVCAFILGWGGLSVHCQTMAAVSGTDLRLGRHFIGRALHGFISAVITVCLYPVLTNFLSL